MLDKIFKQGQYFSPLIATKESRAKFVDLKLPKSEYIADLEIQYRNLLNVNWEHIFPEGMPNNGKKLSILKMQKEN